MTYQRPILHLPPTRQLLKPNEQRFQIARPTETHFEAATCKAVDCPHYLNGWMTVVPTASEQADYIRRESGRHFKETKKEGGISEFVFPPGQKCFREHKKPLDKQEIYIHRTMLGARVHERPIDWVEDMAEEMHKIERIKEGG